MFKSNYEVAMMKSKVEIVLVHAKQVMRRYHASDDYQYSYLASSIERGAEDVRDHLSRALRHQGVLGDWDVDSLNWGWLERDLLDLEMDIAKLNGKLDREEVRFRPREIVVETPRPRYESVTFEVSRPSRDKSAEQIGRAAVGLTAAAIGLEILNNAFGSKRRR